MAADDEDGARLDAGGKAASARVPAPATTTTTTTDVATELGLPNPTTHRTLGDLAAHGVLERESQGQGKPDLWRFKSGRPSVTRRTTTSSEMSETSF